MLSAFDFYSFIHSTRVLHAMVCLGRQTHVLSNWLPYAKETFTYDVQEFSSFLPPPPLKIYDCGSYLYCTLASTSIFKNPLPLSILGIICEWSQTNNDSLYIHSDIK